MTVTLQLIPISTGTKNSVPEQIIHKTDFFFFLSPKNLGTYFLNCRASWNCRISRVFRSYLMIQADKSCLIASLTDTSMTGTATRKVTEFIARQF